MRKTNRDLAAARARRRRSGHDRRRCRRGSTARRRRLPRGDRGPGDDAAPFWSPTGKQIAFSSQVNGLWQIYTVNAGGGSRRQLTHGNLASVDLAWSPTGKQIAFSKVVDGQVITSGHVYVIERERRRPARG